MNSQLLLQIAELPAPSSMQWKDVPKILVNSVIREIPIVKFQEEVQETTETEQETTETTIQKMSEYITMIDRIFLGNTSEMDACHRVFFTFLPIFSIYKNVKISS